MLCSACGREVERTYWHRAFPYFFLCESCFKAPEHIDPVIQRSAIARVLWETRKINRKLAIEAYKSLRGKGIEQNLKRMGRKDDEPNTQG